VSQAIARASMSDPTQAPAVQVLSGQTRPSITAEITCAQRALETLAPRTRRLVDDPFARHFLQSPTYRLRSASRPAARLTRKVFDALYPGFMAVVLLRHRYYEQALDAAVEDGIGQVVLLGAGYDTTALRRDLGDARVFEVDAAPTQLNKRDILRRKGLREKANVEYVPCDFERDSLPECLRAHGFDPTARSLVVWYGVSFFLTEAAVRRTLADVAQISAPGSRFLWDYLERSVVEGRTTYVGAQRARRIVARRGEPYTFGLTRDGAAPFLDAFGFETSDHATIADLARRYGGASGVWCRTDDFFGVLFAERTRGAR
jgi:methyltransferase (TIGR00027 family)